MKKRSWTIALSGIATIAEAARSQANGIVRSAIHAPMALRYLVNIATCDTPSPYVPSFDDDNTAL
ncbi:MAG: hypothetical protein GY782_05610 [Gammaproteobacteria bacterium]|nr:hypothetical protein [Gammaproteobacteria bacterium]